MRFVELRDVVFQEKSALSQVIRQIQEVAKSASSTEDLHRKLSLGDLQVYDIICKDPPR